MLHVVLTLDTIRRSQMSAWPSMAQAAESMFTQEALSEAELASFLEAFDRDGFVAMPGVLTAAGARGFADEILNDNAYLAWLQEGDNQHGGRFGLRPHNDKGPFAAQTVDAPLIQQLVTAVMEEPQLCHTTISVSHPGATAGGFHQDHHHFRKVSG